MIYKILYQASGRILFITNAPLTEVDLPAYDAVGIIESDEFIPVGEYYVVAGELVLKPPQPEKYYLFDYTTKQWYNPRPYDVRCGITNLERNQLLTDSDWTQIPNNPLTPEKQQQWATYRQELRDVTQQSGYPDNVIWPTPPQG